MKGIRFMLEEKFLSIIERIKAGERELDRRVQKEHFIHGFTIETNITFFTLNYYGKYTLVPVKLQRPFVHEVTLPFCYIYTFQAQ